jgi:serine/threonine-protein kinase
LRVDWSGAEKTREPGQRVGKFVLIERIGQGGLGSVYRAQQTGLGRTVALKFLHSDHPEDAQRLAREARLAARLSHPSIVPIYEIGEEQGRPYLAMEFIPGETLWTVSAWERPRPRARCSILGTPGTCRRSRPAEPRSTPEATRIRSGRPCTSW